MRIGVFTRCLHNGGTERVISTLSVLWHEMGHEVCFFTILPEQTGEFDHYSSGRECLDLNVFDADQAKRLQKKYSIDIAIINGMWTDAGLRRVIEVFTPATKVPVAVIIHHCVNNWVYTFCNHEDYEMDSYLNRIGAIVCVDQLQALWWRSVMKETVCIPNPVAKVFARQDAYMPSKNLVWVGRLNDASKRAKMALDIFEKVVERDPDARLLLLGDVSDRVKRGLLQGRSKLACSRIEFLGYRPDANRIIAESGLHIFTSLLEVTVCQVILEAQALGVPTVSVSLPVMEGLSEDDGIVFADTIDDFAESIVALISDSGRLKKLSECALRKAKLRETEIDVKQLWQNLLEALTLPGRKEAYFNQTPSFMSLSNCMQLLHEVRRGEGYFVAHHLPRLIWLRKWKFVFNGIMNRLLGRSNIVSILES